MADRFPLIANTSANQIQELSASDNLDLTGNSIIGVSTIGVSTVIVGSAVTMSESGIDVTGIVTSTSFSGSAASLTSIPAANIVGVATAGFERSGGFGGGGGMEFVSKTTVSSSTGSLDFTLDADSIYRFVCRRFEHTSNSNVLMKLMVNGGSTLYNGGDIRVYFVNDSGDSTRSASDVEFDPGSNYGQNDFFIMDVSTYLYGWFLVDGGLLSSAANTPSGHHSMRYRIYGQIDNYTATYISTVRLQSRFASIDTGTEVLLYKYKQS